MPHYRLRGDAEIATTAKELHSLRLPGKERLPVRLVAVACVAMFMMVATTSAAEAHELDDYFSVRESGRCAVGISKIAHASYSEGDFEVQTKSRDVGTLDLCYNVDVPAGQIRTQLQTYVRIGDTDNLCYSTGATTNSGTTYEHRIRDAATDGSPPCTPVNESNDIRVRGLNQVWVNGGWLGGYTMTPPHLLPNYS